VPGQRRLISWSGRLPHAAQTVIIQLGNTTLRIIDQHGELITTVPRVSDGEISRFKTCGAASGIDLVCGGSAPASREV
jgi:hypothetical protein